MRQLVFVFVMSLIILFTRESINQGRGKVKELQIEKEDTFRLSLLFIGDIMQHEPQINSAWDEETGTYSYDHCFQYVKDIYEITDVTIANLEFTFGGKPYKGYPQFSAPDKMGVAIKNAGIDVLVTANNHTCDRGKSGIIRTINVIDSLEILRTGSFLDSADREKHNPLIIDKNGMRVALLNYTYGTNGLPIPSPTIVNLIDTNIILSDIIKAKSYHPDEIIIVYHWGNEYERMHNAKQTEIAEFSFRHGVGILIGSHPHVIQPIHKYEYPKLSGMEVAVVYSLGNYISNQRQQYRDGGIMVYLNLIKIGNLVKIEKMGYILTWVWTPIIDGKKRYYIVPVSKYEQEANFFDAPSYEKFKVFRDDTRKHLQKNNINVDEILWDEKLRQWVF